MIADPNTDDSKLQFTDKYDFQRLTFFLFKISEKIVQMSLIKGEDKKIRSSGWFNKRIQLTNKPTWSI